MKSRRAIISIVWLTLILSLSSCTTASPDGTSVAQPNPSMSIPGDMVSMSPSSVVTPSSSYWSDTPRGQTIGNQVNSGGGSLAVADPQGGGFLATMYGIQHISASGDVLPGQLRPYGGNSINLLDGRLYFTFGGYEDPGINGVPRGVASMNTDGSDLTVLADDEAVVIQVIGESIYYSCVFEEDGTRSDGDLNDGYISRLCRMNLDGTGKQVILDRTPWSEWTVLGDYIYVEFRSDTKEYGLFRVPLSGPSDAPVYEVLLSDVGKVNGFDLTQDGAYVGTESGLVHVSFDGKQQEWITRGANIEAPVVINGRAYFALSSSDGYPGPIAWAPLSGGDPTVIANVKVFSPGSLVGDWLYIEDGPSGCAYDYYGKVRLDGSGLQSLVPVLTGPNKENIRC